MGGTDLAPRLRLCFHRKRDQVMKPFLSRDAELRVLSGLCRALIGRGLCVQMRDAVPKLIITRPGGTATDIIGYVVVNRRKGEVSWWRVDNLHPVRDLGGAVDRITAFMTEPTEPYRPGYRP